MGSIAELNEAILAKRGVDPDADPQAVLRMAAVHITLWAWRNSPFEDVQIGVPASMAPPEFADAARRAVAKAEADGELWEPNVGGLGDGQMMAANVEATVAVLDHLTLGAADWEGIERTLCDPARLVAGEPLSARSAQDDVAALYRHIHAMLEVYRALDSLVGWPRLHRAFAVMAHSGWWGMPDWPDTVDAFFDELDPAAWADLRTSGLGRDYLRDQLVRAPHELALPVLSWALEHGLRYAHGLDAYRRRVGMSEERPEPTSRAWHHLTGWNGHQPAPAFWDYARRDLESYTPADGEARPPSRQVVVRDSVSVWVNALTCAGVARLLERAARGDRVWLNGNPLQPQPRLPDWLVGRPEILGEGTVTRTEERWLTVAVEQDVNSGILGYTAGFVDLSPERSGPPRVDGDALADALGTLGPDGRYRARLWVARGAPRKPVSVLHWPAPAEVDAAVRP